MIDADKFSTLCLGHLINVQTSAALGVMLNQSICQFKIRRTAQNAAFPCLTCQPSPHKMRNMMGKGRFRDIQMPLNIADRHTFRSSFDEQPKGFEAMRVA